MKLAIFSDIHGNLPALKAILDDINNNNYDQVICLGDTIGIGPKSKETLELVLNSNVDYILGNHELYYIKGIEIDDEKEEDVIKHHRYIHNSIKEIPRERLNFPLSKEININGKKLVFQHYMFSNDTSDPYPFSTLSLNNMNEIENYCKNMDCDYLFVGHEHKGFEVHENNKHIICIGSSGCVKTNKTFYTFIDIDDHNIKITKKEIIFNRDEFINDVRKTNYPARDFIAKELFGIDNIKEGE